MAATLAPRAGGEQFVLEGVSWQLYEMLLRETAERHIFITYDNGRLELMSPSPEHEWWKRLIGRLIEVLALERFTDVDGLGSTTFKRPDLAKGLEPDECYYLHGAGSLRREREADLTRHAAPDLVLEVDISPRAIDRESPYAAMGVPEVWRFDGRRLSVLLLEGGSYVSADTSAAFLGLRAADVQRFLDEAQDKGQGPTVLAFRDWVRSGGATR